MVKSNTTSDLDVRVFDLQGKLLFKGKGSEVIVPSLHAGIVILDVRSQNGIFKEKVVL